MENKIGINEKKAFQWQMKSAEGEIVDNNFYFYEIGTTNDEKKTLLGTRNHSKLNKIKSSIALYLLIICHNNEYSRRIFDDDATMMITITTNTTTMVMTITTTFSFISSICDIANYDDDVVVVVKPIPLIFSDLI
ncbi:hypothetical protein Glove_318g64 [Diversispora epigaea]|uniref:Uncharacterized protein n=1 Tax=Diversispora epigaea TaxID=1348612 RepID=A0A397HQW0_9GLOM|nr:hypothetical protein Glove_318g64 [Diversispora epigaea]